jgi:hypothetical protein
MGFGTVGRVGRRKGQKPHARLFGLVPDGVATIKFDFPRSLHLTTPVKDNVVALDVPRDITDAMVRATQTWLGPDGATVRVIKNKR